MGIIISPTTMGGGEKLITCKRASIESGVGVSVETQINLGVYQWLAYSVTNGTVASVPAAVKSAMNSTIGIYVKEYVSGVGKNKLNSMTGIGVSVPVVEQNVPMHILLSGFQVSVRKSVQPAGKSII